MLIVNADDWGRDRLTTDRILDCVTAGAVSAVSAMVFAEDSERAAALALDRSIDVGLHLNFTSPFTAAGRTAPPTSTISIAPSGVSLAEWLSTGTRLTVNL